MTRTKTRLRFSLVWKINLMVLGGMLVLLGSSVTFNVLQSSSLGETNVRLALTGACTAASLILRAEDTATATPESTESPGYVEAQAALVRLAEAFGLSDLYVVRPGSEADSWEFVFDTADGPFDEESGKEGGFSLYESPPDEMVQAWTAQETIVTETPYSDEYGTFRSAFLVLADAEGTPRAIIGSDFDLVQLTNARNEGLLLSSLLLVLGLGLIGGLGWALVRMIDVPLKQVSRRFTALAQGTADFTDHVEVRTRDELGELGAGFNAFVDKLRDLVTDLKAGVGEAAHIQGLLLKNSEDTSTTLAKTRQGLESLTSSGTLLEASIVQVLSTLESLSDQGASLDSLARRQEETTDRAAKDHEGLDQRIRNLRTQAHAVGKALSELDRDSTANAQRMEAELGVLRQLSGAVESVNAVVTTLVNTADSTGLLAMNASIEAAHAGAQGRGFAVIAQRMRQQSETSRADADRIAATLGRMVSLIGEAASSAQATSAGSGSTHLRIEAAAALVSQLTESGDHLEDYSRRSHTVLEDLRAASRGVAAASGAVAAGTNSITESTRLLREVSTSVLGGSTSITAGAEHLSAVVEDIHEIVDRLSVVSRSLEDNLRRIKTG